jgi:hypothetical protein
MQSNHAHMILIKSLVDGSICHAISRDCHNPERAPFLSDTSHHRDSEEPQILGSCG